MNDVLFAHKPRLLDVSAQLERSAHGSKLCAVTPVLQTNERTYETTFQALKVTSQVAAPGAESAVYDCLLVVVEVGGLKSTDEIGLVSKPKLAASVAGMNAIGNDSVPIQLAQCRQFPMLKYKDIFFQIKYTESVLLNSSR